MGIDAFIPSAATIIAMTALGTFLWRVLDKRFDVIDKRFDVIDERFDVVDERFDGVDKRFEAVDKRSTRSTSGFDQVDRRGDSFDARLEKVDARFDRLEASFDAKFESIDAKVDSLAKDSPQPRPGTVRVPRRDPGTPRHADPASARKCQCERGRVLTSLSDEAVQAPDRTRRSRTDSNTNETRRRARRIRCLRVFPSPANTISCAIRTSCRTPKKANVRSSVAS